MSQSWEKPPSPVHCLHTSNPLHRIAWRPDHETELVVIPLEQSLASSSIDPTVTSMSRNLDMLSFSSDNNTHLEIWDVRRHFVAKYSLPPQDGCAVDAAWGSESTLIACFRDGGFAQLDTTRRSLPLNDIPRQTMAWNVQGELAFALDRFQSGEIPFDDL